MNRNNNKVAIVTGAAQNIGRATCIELAKLDFNILIHANTDNCLLYTSPSPRD